MSVEWTKSLWRGDQRRRTFNSWAIPVQIRQQYLIEDGDQIDTRIHIGERVIDGNFNVSSGGEILVDVKVARQIEEFAYQNDTPNEIRFSALNIPSPLADIPRFDIANPNMSSTERDALISARIGHDQFRMNLLKRYQNRCAVTQVGVVELLRASHIKPWCESNNAERLCVDNGILLVANLDAAFDNGLISFTDEGILLFNHERLGDAPHITLGIQQNVTLTAEPSDEQKVFLKYHRDKFGF